MAAIFCRRCHAWATIRNLSDADLKAIFAYLRTIKPVKNQVPFPVPPGAPVSMAH